MAGQRRERKVVTVVFCDLVGFTSQAEALDPEDVEAILRPYHERVRSELERHGGTVEKFIGDAVMALFGAPTAHEDDPERAVRAALAIRDFALEEGLELRVGITSGEALVRLDVQPQAGEGMASGDVVNTAARLQSAAPVNGILVDESTYRATRHTIDYEPADAVEAKGKTDAVPVWHAMAAHSRFGVDVAHEARSELVGRERELAVVQDAFERARHARTPQLLTLVGVPGIGKSRLVYELQRIVDADPELVTWRQGRCLAYGDGVTMWALAEIVKAQAGIHEQDTDEEVAHKTRRLVDETLAGTGDETWVEHHLLALLGLAGQAQVGGDRRSEAFSAWRRLLEGLAEQRPLVLVFEDLHWADESLLDFVDELVDWITDAPLLVVATARPELLDHRPGWGGGKLNATTLGLAPLTPEQTAKLLGHALDSPLLSAEAQAALLERAGGNPLYAEQFAELYVERGPTEDLPLPETLQGIIAARLDGLDPVEKALLQDAAVVGKVFWAGSLGRHEQDITGAFHSLERKGFVSRQRRTSVEGQSELAFAHALVRDVAYGQIPRADRAAKHRRVAEWIESLGRPEDHAEMRVHHWRSALELARASGTEGQGLAHSARLALSDAGDRAFLLNAFAASARWLDEALALSSGDEHERADLLFRRARALFWAYDEERREQALEEARDALLAVGETDHSAEAEALLARVFWERGDGERTRTHLGRAEELAGDSTSRSATQVLAISARTHELAGDSETALRIGNVALAMSEELGLDELQAHALVTVGMAKSDLGDPSGLADMERALELALAIDSPVASTTAQNLAARAVMEGDFDRAEALSGDALRLAERLGDARSVRFQRAVRGFFDYVRGRWDQALEAADRFIAECEAGAPHTQEGVMRELRGGIRHARGNLVGAVADHERAIELERAAMALPQRLAGILCFTAEVRADHGDLTGAAEALDEALTLIREHGVTGQTAFTAGIFARLGRTSELRAAIEQAPRSPPFWRRVALLAVDDPPRAADALAAAGAPQAEARVRLYAGERLLELGDRGAAEVELRTALAFWRSVDATVFVERCESLLATAQSASA